MIETIEIRKWKEILDLEIEFPLDFFRGQADASWELSSSLYRCLQGTDYKENPENTEFWLLRNFRARAGQYLAHLPKKNDLIAWLSLMQHHGAPTRLVDFTHSFYIAVYFALIGARGDSAVWAIDPHGLFEIGHKAFNLKPGALRDEWEDKIYVAANTYLSKILRTAIGPSDGDVLLGAVPLAPIQHNIRSGTQQGVFVCPLNSGKTFLQNLAPFMEKPASHLRIRKIVLKHELRDTGLAHMREMNITAETLFPGLDGFARSLVHRLLCM